MQLKKNLTYEDVILYLEYSYKEAEKIKNTSEYLLGYKIKKFLKCFKYKNLELEINKRKYLNKEIKENAYTEGYRIYPLKKIAIYTVIVGKYDQLQEPLFISPFCDYYVFTNTEVNPNSIWKKIDFDWSAIDNLSNKSKNRYLKFFGYELLENYEFSIYIDGNIKIISDISYLVNRISDYSFAFHKHFIRDCIYDEMFITSKLNMVDATAIARQKDDYEKDNIPHKLGLVECGIIVRKKNELTRKVMNEWWNEYIKYETRDQICLIKVLYSNKININQINGLGNNIHKSPSFRIIEHEKK